MDDLPYNIHTWFGGKTPLIRKKYSVIIADPAWNFRSNSVKAPGRNAARYYKTMHNQAIVDMPVQELLADGPAILFLWITGPMLVLGRHLPIMKAWGFTPRAIGFTWIKLNPKAPGLFIMLQDIHMGGGFTTRKNAEFVVIGARGKSLRQSRSVREIIISPRREHSRKPEEFYERVRAYTGDLPTAELFARQARPGIDGWGDQMGKFDGG